MYATISTSSHACRSRRYQAIQSGLTRICLIFSSAVIPAACTSLPRHAANSMCELNVAALDRFFEMASARYDFMLIDLPPAWFAWTSQVVFASDGVIVTGLNTIPSLRQTVETLSAVRESGRPGLQIAVVVNRCERSLVRGIVRRRHVETLLGNERVFYVGEEPMATHSINSGSPMSFTNSYRAIRKDIASLGAFFTELKSSGSPSADLPNSGNGCTQPSINTPTSAAAIDGAKGMRVRRRRYFSSSLRSFSLTTAV